MVGNKFPVSLAILSVATVSFNLIPSGLSARAQVPSARMLESQTIAGVTFEPPNEGTLEHSQGGATRDSGYCPDDDRLKSDQSVLPLVPGNYQQGFTVSDRPTFFVYLPSNSASQVFFILKDKNEDYYYQKTLTMPEAGGIARVQIPEDAPALEIGQNYQWSFVIACQMSVRPDSPTIAGWVKRVEPNSMGISVEQTPSLEMAQSYGTAGIWFDTVATLARLRDQQPENYTSTWEEFLSSVVLEAIASKPLVSSEN
jgi:hypothetical protein